MKFGKERPGLVRRWQGKHLTCFLPTTHSKELAWIFPRPGLEFEHFSYYWQDDRDDREKPGTFVSSKSASKDLRTYFPCRGLAKTSPQCLPLLRATF